MHHQYDSHVPHGHLEALAGHVANKLEAKLTRLESKLGIHHDNDNADCQTQTPYPGQVYTQTYPQAYPYQQNYPYPHSADYYANYAQPASTQENQGYYGNSGYYSTGAVNYDSSTAAGTSPPVQNQVHIAETGYGCEYPRRPTVACPEKIIIAERQPPPPPTMKKIIVKYVPKVVYKEYSPFCNINVYFQGLSPVITTDNLRAYVSNLMSRECYTICQTYGYYPTYYIYETNSVPNGYGGFGVGLCFNQPVRCKL